MSDWGPGIFENDDAMDWVYDLSDFETLSRVSNTLDVIVKNKNDHSDVTDCHIALAAAEVIAAMRGDATTELPEELEEWIGDEVLENDELRAKAEEAVEGILKDSGLKDEWEKTSNYSRWRSIVTDLYRRLAF